ncbi:hypothetical protein ABB55_18375 [Prosthecomicrobium hirschii]|uniref:L,D-TPase catalytic domain-containing protein n=1 Tax=Prosthecodimorpha hirschii TaxID=665126 RepID=A0A0P6VQ18_9HYPH|nr:L,D-transpeptidase [Prosthecomicrobium hirschii]KPL53932.1 hypothetical protein ABB55_18375 [Prosthecomicrobium hirschii]
MRIFFAALLAVLLLPLMGPSAEAAVEARVQISTQKMVVYVDGQPAKEWTVSTGRRGYTTPTGDYKAQWLSAQHRSKKYRNAPMPHSIFFTGGYAVHGTTEVARLGKPASHGCVRLAPANAKELFALVREHGLQSSRIVITQ